MGEPPVPEPIPVPRIRRQAVALGSVSATCAAALAWVLGIWALELMAIGALSGASWALWQLNREVRKTQGALDDFQAWGQSFGLTEKSARVREVPPEWHVIVGDGHVSCGAGKAGHVLARRVARALDVLERHKGGDDDE